jgi:hypothetical protein
LLWLLLFGMVAPCNHRLLSLTCASCTTRRRRKVGGAVWWACAPAQTCPSHSPPPPTSPSHPPPPWKGCRPWARRPERAQCGCVRRGSWRPGHGGARTPPPARRPQRTPRPPQPFQLRRPHPGGTPCSTPGRGKAHTQAHATRDTRGGGVPGWGGVVRTGTQAHLCKKAGFLCAPITHPACTHTELGAAGGPLCSQAHQETGGGGWRRVWVLTWPAAPGASAGRTTLTLYVP